MKPLLTLLLALLLGVTSAPGMAADPDFEQGLSAFRNNDFQSALRHFQQAERNGMDSGRLYYNIGVSHFKLGHYADANTAFLDVANDPELAGLAYYNLALIAHQQNKPDQAQDWLQRCRDSNPDERLLALASTLESRLTPMVKTSPQIKQPGSETRLISINAGHDDNVILRDDNQPPIINGQSDRFIELLGFYQQRRSLQNRRTLSLDASLYKQDYLNLDSYDVGLLRLGGDIEREIGDDWQLRGDSHFSNTTIGGSTSSRTVSILGGLRKRQSRRNKQFDLQISRIDAQQSQYSHLTGWQYQLSGQHSWRQLQQRYILSAKLTRNDRADYRTPTRFSSYSPQRLSLSGKIRRPLTTELDGSLRLDWRHSRYRDANLLADSSYLRRKEKRWRLTADLKHSLSPRMDLQLQYRYSHNDSTLDGYSYRRNQVHIGFLSSW